MGCWNGTCMVSRLPILSGERVKLVFLHSPFKSKTEVTGMSAYCYATDILSPAFLPITGEYDDYGSIENIDKSWNYKIAENVLKEAFGDALKVDGEKKSRKNWTLEDVIYGIERGDLKYKNEKGKWINSNLSFVFIREDIYNTIVETMKVDKIYSELGNEEIKERVDQFRYISFEEHLRFKFEKNVKSIVEAKKLDDKERFIRLIAIDNRLFNSMYGGSKSYFNRGEEYNKFLTEEIENKEIVEMVYKSWSEFECVTNYMEACRTGWMVQSGAGSQNQDWKLHKSIAEKMIDICNQNIEEEEE